MTMNHKTFTLAHDRYFDPDSRQKDVALQLYDSIAGLPLICPHGHVDPLLFADPEFRFSNPAELFVIPDHYIFRMLYSQGIDMEQLGIPRKDGAPVETDPRRIWQLFADNFYLFRGTPTGMWMVHELYDVFNVTTKLTSETAQDIYTQIEHQLNDPDFTPRNLYQRFNVEVLCTTDAATDPLTHHQAIAQSGWTGKILPTFRPDAVINIDSGDWHENIARLSDTSGVEVNNYASFIEALENRRAYFKEMGATATDHAAVVPYTGELSAQNVETIFQNALQGKATKEEAGLFTGHLLVEMARMSTEDGLVMQIHPGSVRNHNSRIFRDFGLDKGADIPQAIDYTQNLRALLEKYGNHPKLTVVLFTLDETTYSRELAPLAGHYPTLKLGPPWWFHDSWNGMSRFFDMVMETAGIYNTAGFNDDTRAFPSIPARHDMWRRVSANWVAGLVVRHVIDLHDAEEMVQALAYGLAKQTYNL
jgi:glucuronate isomerase